MESYFVILENGAQLKVDWEGDFIGFLNEARKQNALVSFPQDPSTYFSSSMIGMVTLMENVKPSNSIVIPKSPSKLELGNLRG